MTEIAIRNAGALRLDEQQTEWTPAQHAALKQLGIDKAPEGDLVVFMHQAQRTGLDPFAKQIYLIGRKAYNPATKQSEVKWTIQTSIEGLRITAQRTGQYQGQTPPEWCGEDGVWRDIWLGPGNPAAARVGILRAGHAAPTYGVSIFKEFAQTYGKEGQLTHMWADKPAHMIAKCAEANGLRKAFPNDLSDIYIPEEMDKEDMRVHMTVSQQQHRPGMSIQEAHKLRTQPAGPEIEAPQEAMADEQDVAELNGLAQQLGLTTPEAGVEYLTKVTGRDARTPDQLKADEVEKVAAALRADIAAAEAARAQDAS